MLALKRIKVESRDPKCIASFTNEIQLMERLRGNPSIVTLIASEVDLSRRTIHMVMEAGETDLNGVLKRYQEASSLTVNFVRLAWQQMLNQMPWGYPPASRRQERFDDPGLGLRLLLAAL